MWLLILAPSLFIAARGQGLLQDKLFTELAMQPYHVAALFFALVVRPPD